MACTDFCHRICSIGAADGQLPAREDLLSILDIGHDGYVIGTIEDLKNRPDCPFCQLILAASLEDKIGTPEISEGGKRAQQPVQVVIFPGEQCLRLSYPSRLGTRLMFVAEDENTVSPDQSPYIARLVPRQQVSPSLVRSWLQKCEDHHGDRCFHIPRGIERVEFRTAAISEELTSNFRLVDLTLKCVRKMPLSTRYITLSYVWGQQPTLRLLNSNVNQFQTPGSLERVMSEIPKTIEDAIRFAISLGERYLWVDTLCLIQDDSRDISVGVEMMNSIYQGSYFTIIAGSGGNADAGLAGFGRARQIPQLVAQLNSKLKMVVTHSIDWHLQRSIYNQRGWTFQELVLPRRAVIFIDDKVHFRCMEANWCEETFSDLLTHWTDPDDSNIIRVPDSADGNLAAWWAYQKLCENYSTRTLRFDGDAIRAMTGILRPLGSGLVSWLAEGLPVYYLDISLLFMSTNGQLRRRAGFPSYSWAGWSGSIGWPREVYRWNNQPGQAPMNLFRWMKEKTFIQWHVWKRSGSIEDVDCIDKFGMPSRIEQFVHEYSHMLSDEVVTGVKETNIITRLPFSLFASHSSSSPRPSFTEHTNKETKVVAGLYDLDLVNSQAEFDKLASRITDRTEWLMIYNWLASRQYHANRGSESAQKPLSSARDREDFDLEFRGVDSSNSYEDDPRLKHVEFCLDYFRERGHTTIPELPPLPKYNLLYFQAISIRLLCGSLIPQVSAIHELESETPPSRHPFQRVVGCPLLTPSGELIGSLHYDTFEAYHPGTEVECLILSRCFEPMSTSALPAKGNILEKEWNMFWIMHIIDFDGISERRGIGQVLDTALANSCAPGPHLKPVLLG